MVAVTRGDLLVEIPRLFLLYLLFLFYLCRGVAATPNLRVESLADAVSDHQGLCDLLGDRPIVVDAPVVELDLQGADNVW